jgi:hypothetical protein
VLWFNTMGVSNNLFMWINLFCTFTLNIIVNYFIFWASLTQVLVSLIELWDNIIQVLSSSSIYISHLCDIVDESCVFISFVTVPVTEFCHTLNVTKCYVTTWNMKNFPLVPTLLPSSLTTSFSFDFYSFLWVMVLWNCDMLSAYKCLYDGWHLL